MESSVVNRFLVLFALIIMMVSCTSSRKSIGLEPGWELLGEQKVGFVRDKDEITVNSASQFTAIRFRVEDHDVRLNDLKITFTNGDKLEPQIDDMVGADQNSRIIELAAEGKGITKIEFKYHTIGSLVKGRANVLVFGRRYAPYGY